ncbi:MAG: hypothetical protein GX989_03530 [Firmicutes bacterium]|nr:hypothetical protein [Bacillota bacterium]
MPQNLEADFLYGLATGIGSLPYREAAPALDLIQETLPRGPHWPQLPQRAKDEGFVQQYLGPLFKLGILNTEKGGTPFFVDRDVHWPEKSADFYELYFSCLAEENTKEDPLSFFAFSPASAAGFYKFLEQKWGTLAERPSFLKGQIAGPLSLGLQLTAGDQNPAFYHDELREMIVKALVLNICFQVRSLKKFSLPVVIFIDEPLLFFYGQQAGISLSREQIGQSLAELVAAIAAEGAYAGIHCCAGADWSILFELSPHIVSFDAYSYFDSLLVYSAEMEAFLSRGGCLAWGLVPTMGGLEAETVFSLQEKFFQGIRRLSRLGVSADLLARQYMLTPSCGAATLSLAEGEQVYRLTFALQELLQGGTG